MPADTQLEATSADGVPGTENDFDTANLCAKCLRRGVAPRLWLAKPVRSIVVVLSFVVLTGVAGYLCSMLQPATGIPSLFADDNNIQIYLSSLALFTGVCVRTRLPSLVCVSKGVIYL